MGLDMCLRGFHGGFHKRAEELGYWRKENAIHNWFCKRANREINCDPVIIDREQLEELKEDCRKVLENHELAKEILPTTSGFFFGSTEYDEWYFRGLRDTIDMIDKIDFNEYEEFEYDAWW